jgi:hypothetical protein
LQQYVKDAGYGKHMCDRCLLNGSRESYDLFGIRDKIVESLHDYVRNYRAELPSGDDCSLQYPCPIVNRLECPYQNNKRFNDAELVAAGGIVNTVIAALEHCGVRRAEDAYRTLTDPMLLKAVLGSCYGI